MAGQYADELLLLHDGRPVAAGSPHDMLDAAVLGESYHASLTVLDPGDDSLAVVPLRPNGRPPPDDRFHYLGQTADRVAAVSGQRGRGDDEARRDASG